MMLSYSSEELLSLCKISFNLASIISSINACPLCGQVAALEAALTSSHTNLLGFCHNDLQYGNMLLHTTAHRSLSFDSLRAHSVERAVKGGSPPPVRGGSPLGRRPRGLSPEPEG